MILTQGHRRT